MIAYDGNADGLWSVERMEEEEEGMKKVEILLRGRLVAEGAASELAQQEAHQLELKLGELETQLKSEMKSKKRAEKKLNFLIKKLKSLNIPYYSQDLEKSDLSSVSSSVSSALTQVEEKDPEPHIKIDENRDTEGFEKKRKCQTGYKEFEDYVSQFSSSNQSQICNNAMANDQRLRSSDLKDRNEENSDQTQDGKQTRSIEEDISYLEKAQLEESIENNGKINDQSFCSSRNTVEKKEDCERQSSEAQEDHGDESLALVVVHSPKEPPQVHIDPLILDENVKQVLNALDRAKQQLLLSMERRHMITLRSK